MIPEGRRPILVILNDTFGVTEGPRFSRPVVEELFPRHDYVNELSHHRSTAAARHPGVESVDLSDAYARFSAATLRQRHAVRPHAVGHCRHGEKASARRRAMAAHCSCAVRDRNDLGDQDVSRSSPREAHARRGM